jgi:thiosulfate reductase cytochrome b subunit
MAAEHFVAFLVLGLLDILYYFENLVDTHRERRHSGWLARYL